MEKYMLPCLNKKIMGVECLGCGIQRAVMLLFKGEFVAAFYMYPAIYSILLLFSFIGINHFFKIKYANIIIVGLLILSFVMMTTNYILKLTNH
ncbi:DUF2752 domain-containing protein [Gangjinia marincola]|uniref:DUF2752 domain-containing protein n=1 Tax=Gangjinia marincola TaxID=578463 RepID=UPI0031DA46DC